jgi:hypothetical protein
MDGVDRLGVAARHVEVGDAVSIQSRSANGAAAMDGRWRARARRGSGSSRPRCARPPDPRDGPAVLGGMAAQPDDRAVRRERAVDERRDRVRKRREARRRAHASVTCASTVPTIVSVGGRGVVARACAATASIDAPTRRHRASAPPLPRSPTGSRTGAARGRRRRRARPGAGARPRRRCGTAGRRVRGPEDERLVALVADVVEERRGLGVGAGDDEPGHAHDVELERAAFSRRCCSYCATRTLPSWWPHFLAPGRWSSM